MLTGSGAFRWRDKAYGYFGGDGPVGLRLDAGGLFTRVSDHNRGSPAGRRAVCGVGEGAERPQGASGDVGAATL